MARATGCGRTASKGANFKLERKAGSCVPVLGQAFPHPNELSSFGRCKVTFISPLQPPIGPDDHPVALCFAEDGPGRCAGRRVAKTARGTSKVRNLPIFPIPYRGPARPVLKRAPLMAFKSNRGLENCCLLRRDPDRGPTIDLGI